MGEGTAAVAKPVQDATATADLTEVVRLLESDELARALTLLETVSDASAEADALQAAVYFRSENYQRAEEYFQRALDKGHADPGIVRLLTRSRANHRTDIRRRVPEPVHFDKDTLLRGPQPGEAPHSRLPPVAEKGLLARAFDEIGGVIGFKFGGVLGYLTQFFPEPQSSRLWTSWYMQDFLRATLMLANRRDRLNRKQLFPVYPRESGVGFFRSSEPSPEWTRWARTADGSWNDQSEPMAGAAGTRFGANTDPTRTRGEQGERLLTPNPRTVSRVLLTRRSGLQPIEFLNLNAASWIQFMTHDWVSYGDAAPDKPHYRIALDADDPARRLLHQTHMLVRPTQGDVTHREGEPDSTHINEVTAWWDGSQVYGSDAQTQQALRAHQGGKLKLDPVTGHLPVLDGVEHTGFRRNWWVGLSMLHTLFAHEHNAICDTLAVHYPKWSDRRLFDTARLINAAVMAKIHTVEWTPAVLPNLALNSAMNANWYGILTNLLRSKRERKTVARINVADPIAGGIVGNARDLHGVPYALTREFTSVYRLHSLLPDEIGVYRIGRGEERQHSFALAELRQAAAPGLTRSVPVADWFYSFGIQHPGQLVLNNFPDTLQNLSIPGVGFYDLGAVDVLRDRERGVPRYNEFRRLIGLRPLSGFADLTQDREQIQALQQVYESIEDVDLLVGNLAESTRPEGFGFGETLFEVFILNASRRLQADRFFTEDYRADVYTPEGLAWIDDVTFKSVLLRHYPALRATGLSNVENAFEPWDLGELDPKRHPLRQFDLGLLEYDHDRKQRN